MPADVKDETAEERQRGGEAQAPAVEVQAREPYTAPVIEKFPPLGNVTFGTNVQPMLAMTLVG